VLPGAVRVCVTRARDWAAASCHKQKPQVASHAVCRLPDAGSAASSCGQCTGYMSRRLLCPGPHHTCAPRCLQARAHGKRLPLAIMTSDDTHERTVKLLEQHHYFGMSAKQVGVPPGQCRRCCCCLCCLQELHGQLTQGACAHGCRAHHVDAILLQGCCGMQPARPSGSAASIGHHLLLPPHNTSCIPLASCRR
jgi:hypothetical protein